MGLSPSAHVDTFSRDNLPPESTWPELLFTLPELAYPDRLNCATTLLDDTAARLGRDRPCLLTDAETWTYGRLIDTANRVAATLTDDYGVVPGNRVLLRGPNNPWLVACWFGVLKAGAVVVTTMPLLRPTEISEITEISTPSVALCDARFTDDLVKADAPNLRVVTYGDGELDDAIGAHEPAFTDVSTAADDVALIAFTSGSTGHPKATMHFHRDVLANADTFSRQVLRPRPEDVFLGSAPLAFTFGLGMSVVFPLHAGAATLLVEKATPKELAEAVQRHGITVLATAPTAYRAILADGYADQLGSLRRCVSAGETLPASVSNAFHEATGIRIIDGIGATEMLHIFVSAADGDVRPGATGRAVPGYVAAVLDDDGNPVPDGEPGHLAVKGPTGCRYLSDPRQAEYVRHGWNYTGDTYVRDADGYFWYQARSDDMIVSAGYNIAGPEVENALLAHPDVIECGVVATPDDARGSIVKAFVVLRDGVPGDDAECRELQEFVKRQIAPYKYPRAIEFVDALPRTSTGKLQRFQLRERSACG